LIGLAQKILILGEGSVVILVLGFTLRLLFVVFLFFWISARLLFAALFLSCPASAGTEIDNRIISVLGVFT
jgi:hypothetical protein